MKNIYKPILFSTEMVKADLGNRKTQTRRIAPFDKFCTKPFQTGNGKWQENYNNNPDPKKEFPGGWNAITNYKSKYQPGDILWVRETWQESECFDFNIKNKFAYKANNIDKEHAAEFKIKWRPSIHMPKEAARIFLKVTKVRVERLQDISEGDAIAEGVELFDTNLYKDYEDNGHSFSHAIISFSTLWDSIYAKKHPWSSNPWVWVYEFERIDKPKNFIP